MAIKVSGVIKSRQPHRIQNIGWLRAAVLGANDGIISTASLVLGVASAHAQHGNIVLTAAAGLVAGSMSMAAGEFVSVSSQEDTERQAISEERHEIADDYDRELKEMAAIYKQRGLDMPLAKEVAQDLMQHDALGTHVRDELGISDVTTARPLQAALTSAASFASGALLPLAVAVFIPEKMVSMFMIAAALLSLALLGTIAAKIGGSKIWPSVRRITFWSALAMGVSCSVGILFESFT